MSTSPNTVPSRNESLASPAERGMKAALTGLGVNAAMVTVKLLAGILGHSYALVADAVESSTDIFSSLIVWAGLRVTTRPADEDYPYGYGKAETLAAAIVSLMLLGAALGIAVAAVREIRTPHHMPAPFTLAVIAVVVVVKEVLSRRVLRVGEETGSTAVKADAWHHRSDALTSAAAFIGISVALWGGPGWESADDWAALVASGIIAINGFLLLRPAIRDLMDRMPEDFPTERIAEAARGVEGVRSIEKLRVRRLGTEFFVDLHVQADRMIPLWEAHVMSGKVKGAIRSAVPNVAGVLVHMEPFD
ncbi:cation diffusion facilitator family transporter [Paludisphaera rhizosphaerae]|uniref:cation diffusion facilitator family transporter n=1 Tax=Paludisphaera rhizosphaerae TaxID=2711216 RepID=UPI001F10E83F|nr:cation diffusion facilitator family transporter [Paludisphaera rhizosphaerae]